MGAQKRTSELVVYIFSTFFTVGGTALCLAGLLLPNWYNVRLLEGIVVVGDARLGLWQDELCPFNSSCTSLWRDGNPHVGFLSSQLPQGELIRGIETAGAVAAVLSLFSLVAVWVFRGSNKRSSRLGSFSAFFSTSLVAAFLSVIGCLIIASKGDKDLVGFASLLSGIGGAALFVSVCMACAVCRYDPSYGTLENPVSPKFSKV